MFYTKYHSVLCRPQLLIYVPDEILYNCMYDLQRNQEDVKSYTTIDYMAFYKEQLFTKQVCTETFFVIIYWHEITLLSSKAWNTQTCYDVGL